MIKRNYSTEKTFHFCYFCGNENVSMKSSESRDRFWAHCSCCHAEGPIANTQEDAVRFWNVPSEKRFRLDDAISEHFIRTSGIRNPCRRFFLLFFNPVFVVMYIIGLIMLSVSLVQYFCYDKSIYVFVSSIALSIVVIFLVSLLFIYDLVKRNKGK